MARSDAVHAAVATLEALCFGGKGDTPNERDAYAYDELEDDAYDAATKKKEPTSCVASSATLAATRAVALEGVPPRDTSKGSTHTAASAFASSSSPSPGTSPEEKEYAAFLRWLDGGANAAAETSEGFERKSSGSDLARDQGSAFGDRASLGDRVTNATNATTKTNATKGGRRKTKTIPSSRVAVAALVVVAALLAAAALLVALVVSRRVIAERARRRRGDGSIARANVCAEHAALALENGDEVRLVARRRAPR